MQEWAPSLKKDQIRIEGVQRRATKLIPEMRNKEYEERLEEINPFSISYRRARGDLIQVYKIFNRIDNVDLEPLIELSQTGIRSD